MNIENFKSALKNIYTIKTRNPIDDDCISKLQEIFPLDTDCMFDFNQTQRESLK